MSGNNEVESADGDGDIHVEPVEDAAEQVPVNWESLVSEFPSNQEQQAEPSYGESVHAGNVVQIAPDDTRVTEDGGKDDFVDCPDEVENSGPQMDLEGKDDQQDSEVKELSNGRKLNDLMAEIEHLHHMLEHTMTERDNYAKKYEEKAKSLREFQEISYMKDHEIQKYQHVEESTSRMLASLGASVYQEGIVDESISGKMYYVENAMSFLLDKYNLFLYGIDQLKMSLVEVNPDIPMQEVELFGSVCNNLLGLNRKVVDLDQKLAQAEDGSKQLMEQLKEHNAAVQSETEISKLKAELEQERTRYASNKEKLSLAVTKGKTLVQQRDSLKQSLTEKTSELDKCMVQLNEKSSALETAERKTDLLVKNETLVASLQETLEEKVVILRKCEEILLKIVGTDENQSMDIIEKVRYLTEELDKSVKVSSEFRKLVNALSSFDFPETVKFNGLDAKIVWLIESVDAAQQEAYKLQDEIFKMEEAAHDDIGRLSSLLLAETQDKDYLQVELDDLGIQCDKIAASEQQAILEKNGIIIRLQEASGVALNDQEKKNQALSDVAMIVDTCISKFKDDLSASFNFSNSTVKNFEKMQNLLYISNMNVELYGKMLEEVMFGRSETSSVENELVGLRNELILVNGGKDSLQKDLEQSEEKAALLREKLSKAVKKGKGLFQERENLRKDLDEKNIEIENLKLELQEQRTACNNLRDEINRLTVDSERVPQLETDIFAIQEQKNQVEKFLAESNSMLQKVLESIDSVGLPDNKTFDEPVEKVNWLAGFLSESQRAKILADQDVEIARKEVRELADEMEEMKGTVNSFKDALFAAETKISVLINEKERLVLSKTYVEQELKKAIEEKSPLTNKYTEVCVSRKVLKTALQDAERNIAQLIDQKEAANASRASAETELMKLKEEKASRAARDLANEMEGEHKIVKSLKKALSDAENKISELKEENEDLSVSKKDVEQELKKEIEEYSSLTNKFAEVCLIKKSLEEALQAAERNITQLTNDKEAAISSSAATEIELEKVKEDVTVQTSKLSEADRLKQSLEDALSTAQENLSLLAEDNKKATSNNIDLENELRRLKEEAHSHVLRFSDADSTIKSLQDSLSSAEERVSGLVNEKRNAEEEISSLNLKINACLQELAGKHGSLESSSMELSGHLSSLRKLLKGDTLSSSLLQSFEKKIGGLNDMNLLLQDVRESIIEVDSKELQNFSFAEDEIFPSSRLSSGLDDVLDVETSNGKESSTDADSIVFYIGKTVERLQLRDKVLAERVKDFSAFMDNLILSLLKKLGIVKTMLHNMPELIKSLKQKVDELDSERQALKDDIFMLESYNGILLPACTDATKQLKLEFEQCLSELKSNSHIGRLNDIWSIDLGTFEANSVGDDRPDLGSNKYVKEAEEILLAARQSRDLSRHFQSVVNKMITAIDNLQNELKESKTTSEKLLEERTLTENEVMKLKDDLEKSDNACKDMRVSLEEYRQRENNLKESETNTSSKSVSSLKMSASQTKSLSDKINRIDVSTTECDAGNLLFHDSSEVEKLFYVVDSYAGLKHQISLLSAEKEKLHATIDYQVSGIKHLKEKIEEHDSYLDEKDKMKSEQLNLAIGMESIIQKLGGGKSVDCKKEVFGVTGLLQVLETQVVASNLESTNLKAKAEELNHKLLEMQKVVDNLSSKNRLPENSSQAPEKSHKRGVLESSSSSAKSEISEIQDMGPVGKNKATPSAPHPRTLRKGSSDQLSIVVDSDSEPLIKEEKNEDKGHVFKSLNTSGLIPRQGKMIADRVDGIWVSGSRALKNQPRARLGVITYWLLVHLWLLGSIL